MEHHQHRQSRYSFVCRLPTLITILLILALRGEAAQIDCPVLLCDNPVIGGPIDYDLCWTVDIEQPMKTMRSYDCDWYIGQEKSNLEIDVVSTCDFDVTSGAYAWVDELTQGIKPPQAGSLEVANSQFNHKKTEAYCREVAALNQNLNNGRTCSNSFQCRSGVCEDGKCKGLSISQNCHDHEDCAEGLFCENTGSWPWTFTCSKLKTSYQICTEDAECQAGSYCWYASPEKVVQEDQDTAKQCLPYYSQSNQITIGWKNLEGEGTWEAPTVADLKHNGQYCDHGLAFPVDDQGTAKCSQVDKVFHQGKEIQSPYQCDPTDNEAFCRFQYNTTDYDGLSETESAFFEVPCRCSMDGDTGFCGSILGTPDFATGAAQIKNLYTQSQCHTYDRGDYRAMQEECCLANADDWESAADWEFKINNWPYVNAKAEVRDCFYQMNKLSPANLAKAAASALDITLVALSAALIATSF